MGQLRCKRLSAHVAGCNFLTFSILRVVEFGQSASCLSANLPFVSTRAV